MKKIIGWILIAILLGSAPAMAAQVNLNKPGTSWVWRVDAGDDIGYLLFESGAIANTEAAERIGIDYRGTASVLYNVLVHLGWVVVDTDANIPQGGTGTDANAAYDFALIESGATLVLENGNNVRLEN